MIATSTETKQGRRLSKAVRAEVGMSGKTYPIVVEEGNDGPRVEGEPHYHTTPSGKTIVRYPGAYKWPTLYHPSTIRIVVGMGWLVEKGLVSLPPVVSETALVIS